MKANSATVAIPSATAHDVRRGLPRRRLVAAVVALVALGACTSDPGPKRVAQDIIKAESEMNPDLDEECLLDQLDKYSNDDLEAIANGLSDSSTAAERTAAEGELAAYQASLESCLS